MIFKAGHRTAVLLPLPLAGCYDYLVPENTEVKRGDFVTVPFGNRKLTGVVWGKSDGKLPEIKLKKLLNRIDAPPLPEEMLKFINWVAGYTMSPLGAVLKMAMSVPDALLPAKENTAYIKADSILPELRITNARRKILSVVSDKPLLSSELAAKAGTSASVVRGLAEAGGLKSISVISKPVFAQPNPDYKGAVLSDEQQKAADVLVQKVNNGFSATLIDGVTGSGKTEVYFAAIAEALKSGKQSLVLVPEIALTSQWLERFKRRFDSEPAMWHSDLSKALRRETWKAVASCEVKVVVGARSALFLPFNNLGVIIVDEEHETSFKQEEGVMYHARDMAVVRANIDKIPVILASATPSLETVNNVHAERYDCVYLRTRHAKAAMPNVKLIDMRINQPKKGERGVSWISPPLNKAIERTLENDEQVMLFLNRRGYAPLTLCRACGHRLKCPNCSAWLVEHRKRMILQCHHCGYSSKIPKECPECEKEDSFVACGPGIERLAEEVECRFPDANIATIASDTLVSPSAISEVLQKITNHEIDIIIGTQILAKGHHFPLLTLVGVIDADLGLSGGDLRASERTFQLLNQVAGRAGRAELEGQVLVQTYEPEHLVMEALISGDSDDFMGAESEERKILMMPPFGRMAALIVSGTNENAVLSTAGILGRTAPHGEGVRVLGPADAPLFMLRGRYRQRLLLKTKKDIRIQPILSEWLAKINKPSSVRIQVDIDPYSFL